MTNQVGLWIDHKQAVIVGIQEQGESVQKIESGAQRIEWSGKGRRSAAGTAQYGQGDDQLDNQFMEQLKKYYDRVAALLRGTGSILILGPGEARTELRARLKREKGPPRDIQVEPADKMTDRQIVARVRAYFAPRSSAR